MADILASIRKIIADDEHETSKFAEGLPRQKSQDSVETKRILRCDFCGKSEHQVRKLVAGPKVFICDECTALSYDAIDPGRAKIKTVRSLEFPSEYKQAGLSILNYFSQYIEDRFPDTNAGITIEQIGKSVLLKIKTDQGKEEIIEKSLEEYSLIVMGKREASDYLDDAVKVARLESQLEVIAVSLKQSERYASLLEQQNKYFMSHSDKQLEHSSELTKGIMLSLTNARPLIDAINNLASNHNNSSQILIKHIADLLEQGITESDEKEAIQTLTQIAKKDQTILETMSNIVSDLGVGASASLLANWISVVLVG